LGLFCEIINFISFHWLGFGSYSYVANAQNLFSSWFSYIVLFFFAWQTGALISLIYYRLGKMQQVVFSVTAIAAIVFGFSSMIRLHVGAGGDLGDLIKILIENGTGFFTMGIWVGLAFGMLAAVGNYLLLRRVQIKE
jgi:hypothetical protein